MGGKKKLRIPKIYLMLEGLRKKFYPKMVNMHEGDSASLGCTCRKKPHYSDSPIVRGFRRRKRREKMDFLNRLLSSR